MMPSGEESTPNMRSAVQVALDMPATVAPGEPVPMALRVTNSGVASVTLALTGIPTAFDLIVSTAGAEIWSRLHAATVPMVLELKVVQPGEVLQFSDEWDQRDNAGRPVPSGSYHVYGILPAEELDLQSETRILVIRP